MANSWIIYIYLSFKFPFFWIVFKTLSETSKKGLFWNLSELKKVPQLVACPIGKMSSWQPNNNDKILGTRYWAIPEIIHRVEMYGAQGHGNPYFFFWNVSFWDFYCFSFSQQTELYWMNIEISKLTAEWLDSFAVHCNKLSHNFWHKT